MTTTILLAGGGIGGLTAAIALAQRGLEVHVYEQAEALRAAGAGITMQINAMRVFHGLGASADIEARGAALAEGRLCDERGQTIQDLNLTRLADEFGIFGVAIHRGRLLEVLADHARRAGVQVHTGLGLTGFVDHGTRVEATFDDGSTATGDALIGCDGLHSRVRATLRGEEPLRYSGTTSWRGVTDQGGEAAGTSEFWGPGVRFGVVPIGFGETYWFAVANAPRGGQNGTDVVAELRERFAAFPPEVDRLIAATPQEAIIRTDICDRPPIDRWGQGRVSLLGDAAHPMTPNLGQGGCQAVEDAQVLAEELDQAGDDLQTGLRRYEARRVERANWFVAQSERFGKVSHGVKATPLRRLRDTVMRITPSSLSRSTVQKMYGSP